MSSEAREVAMARSPRIKRFVECGDADKASRFISMAYLLQSIATAYTEEANAIISSHGLLHFNVKLYSQRLEKAFDMYYRQIASMITTEEVRQAFIADYEKFEKICSDFMKNV